MSTHDEKLAKFYEDRAKGTQAHCSASNDVARAFIRSIDPRILDRMDKRQIDLNARPVFLTPEDQARHQVAETMRNAQTPEEPTTDPHEELQKSIATLERLARGGGDPAPTKTGEPLHIVGVNSLEKTGPGKDQAAPTGEAKPGKPSPNEAAFMRRLEAMEKKAVEWARRKATNDAK